MDTSILVERPKSASEAVVEDVNIEESDWLEKFDLFIRERRIIRFTVHSLPSISKHTEEFLTKHEYNYLVNDIKPDQLFLVPNGSESDLEINPSHRS